MTRLSVNINKVALLRNARGGHVPNLLQFARDCERFGAEGITVHPRPDERHITRRDVMALSEVVATEFNIEGYPDARYLEIIAEARPAQATLVPDPPGVLTSNTGWDVAGNLSMLRDIIAGIHAYGVRVSLFLNPDPGQVIAAKESGADRIELYTGPYAENYPASRETAVKAYAETAHVALRAGLGINAGHDLNLDNLQFFCRTVPGISEVSIGHALICDALYLGIENTIPLYKRLLT